MRICNGFLLRAGKTKRKTPKVEKLDKPKKKKGRAGLRKKYNKRNFKKQSGFEHLQNNWHSGRAELIYQSYLN